MSTLSIAEQITLARRHGFTDDELPDFCAVVMTESGGRTDAVQPNGEGRGLVQIDLGQHPDVTEAEAFDPDFAADFARRLSRNASGLGPTNWYGPRDHPEVAAKARAAARALLAEEAPMAHRIITRAEWGATPAAGMAEADYPMGALWLHHSDTEASDDPAADMRQLQQIAFSRGFSDVSYTFGLHPDGSIIEGRDLRYVGAHTAGHNSTSLAFVLIGNYDDTPPTAAQVSSARWLRDKLISEGYLTSGTYPTGGHRDAPGNSTGCPGAAAEARLDLFRAPQDDAPTPDPVPQEEDDGMKLIPVDNDRGIFLAGENVGEDGKIPARHVASPADITALVESGAIVNYDKRPVLPEAVFDAYYRVVG